MLAIKLADVTAFSNIHVLNATANACYSLLVNVKSQPTSIVPKGQQCN